MAESRPMPRQIASETGLPRNGQPQSQSPRNDVALRHPRPPEITLRNPRNLRLQFSIARYRAMPSQIASETGPRRDDRPQAPSPRNDAALRPLRLLRPLRPLTFPA